MRVSNACPPPSEWRRYLKRELAEAVVLTLRRHLGACESCRRTLSALVAPGPQPVAGAPVRPADPRFAGVLQPPLLDGELGRLGPYRLLRVLGQGGMGVVFEAEHSARPGRVAVKAIRPDQAAEREVRERFDREARAGAAVRNDHVLRVLEVGTERQTPYFVMPLLLGETLETRLKRQPRLPVAEALRIARQTAEGLAALHAAHLMHRDIKPDNLWLGADGHVTILDLGLSRYADNAPGARSGDYGLTQYGAVLGTPEYGAPEQVAGQPDPRSDLFSLGCVLYRMVTGKSPFLGATRGETLRNIVQARPTPPRRVVSAVPGALEALLLRLLARDLKDRPATAQETAAALAALERRTATRRRGQWLRVTAAVAALLVGCGLALWLLSR